MAVKTAFYTSPYDPNAVEQEITYIDGEIILKFRETATEQEINSLLTEQGFEKKEDLSGGATLYTTSADPIALVAQLKGNPIVEIIEPNLTRFSMGTGSEVQRTSANGDAFQNMGLFAVAFVMGLILFARK